MFQLPIRIRLNIFFGVMYSAVHLCRLGLRGCTSIEPVYYVYYVGSRDSSESRPVEAEELHLKYFENQLKVL